MIERGEYLQYGSLIIPTDAQITTYKDSDFGTLRVVRKTARPVYLYSIISSPEHIATLAKQSLATVKTFPYFLSDANEEQYVAITKQLQQGEEVLARRVPGCEGVLEVVTFEKTGKKNADMQETGDGIKITAKGYVLAKDVMISKRHGGFNVQNRAIFPNANLTEDVHQNTFGDCFLLSTVLAILAKDGGNDFIRGMMIQDGDYTVVRLYDPNTLDPIYVRVRNSTYTEDGRNLVKHKADWVHILEKAYTAAAFRKSHDQFVSNFPSFREMFGNGGCSAVAFEILTGQKRPELKKDANEIKLSPVVCPWSHDDWAKCYSVYRATEDLIAKLPATILDEIDRLLDGGKKYEALLSADVVRAELEKCNEKEELKEALRSYVSKYTEMNAKDHKALKEVFKNIRQMAVAGKYYADLMLQDTTGTKLPAFLDLGKPANSTEEAEAYFRAISNYNPPVPEAVVRCYKEYIYKEHRWNREATSGIYNAETVAIYNHLKAIFDNKNHPQALVVSTKDKFPDKIDGLRPQHGYAVTGVCEELMENGATIKFVKVRNPWGRVGRQYDYKNSAVKMANVKQPEKIATEVEDAESKIPMVDFVKYFDVYSYSQFSPPPALTKEESFFLQKVYESNDAATSFLTRHGGKLLIGMGIGIGLLILGLATFGVGPLVVAAAALTFVALPVAVAAVAFAATLVATAIGAAVVALAAKFSDSFKGNSPTPVFDEGTPQESPRSNTASTSSDSDSENSEDIPFLRRNRSDVNLSSAPASGFYKAAPVLALVTVNVVAAHEEETPKP